MCHELTNQSDQITEVRPGDGQICCESMLRFTFSTRPQPSNRGSMQQKIGTKRRNKTRTQGLTWKTLDGKNHGSTRLQTKHYTEKYTMASCKATTLSSLSSPQAAEIHRGVDLFLSLSLTAALSLSRLLSLFTPLEWKNRKMNSNNKTVCPNSYLYTYDFRAIYNYSLKGPWQTYSQICPRIRISLRVHSSSGSETGVFIIRFRNRNRACRHSSSDIRPSHPKGTIIPTNSPFTSVWDVSPTRSSSGMLPACRV